MRTDPVEYARLLDEVMNDPEKLKTLRLEPYALKFANSDLERLASMKANVLKPDKEKDVATTSQLIGTYTGGLKAEKKAAFTSAVFDAADTLGMLIFPLLPKIRLPPALADSPPLAVAGLISI